jgi:hypothetical protein
MIRAKIAYGLVKPLLRLAQLTQKKAEMTGENSMKDKLVSQFSSTFTQRMESP